MKKNYWSPAGPSSVILLLIAVVSLGGIGAVETFHAQPSRSDVHCKLTAATLARQAMQEVKSMRQQRGLPIDAGTDPCQSGLVGCLMSPITTNNGHLPAKQTTINPNFAAVAVDMLREAGVQQGDVVAVGFSGSFPAMNLCVLSAMQAMELRPIVISSTSASQWGANESEMLWIDVEQRLCKQGILHHRSLAASLGGVEDRGIGLPEEGIRVLREAIARNKLKYILPRDYLDSVNQRMAFYRSQADGAPIAAYINVGGGTSSVGTKKGKLTFEPGVNLHKPLGALPVDSVMGRFINQGAPVIHFSQIDDLAMRYGLPVQPMQMPHVGDGDVYAPQTYNRWLAGGVLVVIVLSLAGVARLQKEK